VNNAVDCIVGQPRSPHSLLCLYQARYGMGSKTLPTKINYLCLSVSQMAKQTRRDSFLRYLNKKSTRNFWQSTLNRNFMEGHSVFTRNSCHSLLIHPRKLKDCNYGMTSKQEFSPCRMMSNMFSKLPTSTLILDLS
jgi:hypothetical protein